jgi:hypothetical protein
MVPLKPNHARAIMCLVGSAQAATPSCRGSGVVALNSSVAGWEQTEVPGSHTLKTNFPAAVDKRDVV